MQRPSEQQIFGIGIEPVKIQTRGTLDTLSQSISLTGNLDIKELNLRTSNYTFEDGINYSLELTCAGDIIVAVIKTGARLHTSCSRCLEDAVIELNGELMESFALACSDESDGEQDFDSDDLEDDEIKVIDSDGIIDLTDSIVGSIIMEIPMIILCAQDCKGLCPKCGVNLNYETCDCESKATDDNPFSVLKNFFD